ncbi:MAG: hypothetical protein JNJ77_12595 [Planctomycetia bacterium]|nr:hypothetical protein [Planctomycetia bacterium]
MFLLWQTQLQGNIESYRKGTLNRELNGVHDVIIIREKLTFDLQPLMQEKPIRVEAIYELLVTGEARTVKLVFITGSKQVDSVKCMLDNKLLFYTVEHMRDDNLPKRWKFPGYTPGFSSGELLDLDPYGYKENEWIVFTVSLAKGRHTLAVGYDSVPFSRVKHLDPVRYWQIAYILSPAREWKAFQGLDLTVTVPAGWNFACTLPTQKDNNVYTAHFDSLPADTMAITTQYKMTAEQIHSDRIPHSIVIAVFALLVLFCLRCNWIKGITLAGNFYSILRSSWTVFWTSTLLSIFGIYYISSFIIGKRYVVYDVPFSQTNWNLAQDHFYITLFAILVGLILLPCFIALMCVVVWYSRRKHLS